MYKIVRSSRLYEQIVQQVEESIVKGTLKPGDQLPPERELAEEFGVSRTAVREAVKALREKGLVEAYPGRGTFITDGTSHAIRQSLDRIAKIGQPEGSAFLAEVRAILEPEIAALAAVRASEQELASMREPISVMDEAREDPDAFIEADLDFHLALAEAAANPLILSLIDSIVALLREQARALWSLALLARSPEGSSALFSASRSGVRPSVKERAGSTTPSAATARGIIGIVAEIS